MEQTGNPEAHSDRTWIAGGLGIFVLLLALKLIVFDGDLAQLSLTVRSTGLVLAGVVVVASHLYWRATGEAAGYLVATAAGLIAVGILAELARTPDSVPWLVLCSAPLLLAAVWVGRAITGPTVDATSGPLRQVVIASLSLAIVWGVATGLAATVDVTLRTLVVLAHVAAASAWTIVAVLGLFRALRGTTVLRAWSTWMAMCLALSTVAHLLGRIQADGWIPFSGALRLSALLSAAIGAAVGLSRSAIGRREALHGEAIRHRAEGRRRDEVEREHDHEIRTALLAIEGATLTLERHSDHLGDEQREQLSGAVRSGMEHLRSLTTAQPAFAERHVLDVLEDRITLARGRGLTVELRQTAGPIEGRCEPRLLGQVLDNLLTNAERHGGRPGPVRIDVEVEGRPEEVVMRVSDDGPGIPEHAHERVFEPGRRLHQDVEGEGIGLPLARRLLRERGGDLDVKPSVRGACFEVRLPVSPAAGEAIDEPQDGRQVVEAVVTRAAAASDLSPAPRRRSVVEYHRELSSRLKRRRRHDGEIEDLVLEGAVEHDGHVGDLLEERPEAVAQQRRRR